MVHSGSISAPNVPGPRVSKAVTSAKQRRPVPAIETVIASPPRSKWKSRSCSRGGRTGDGIEQRPKLKDERVKWGQVAPDPGQDDGPLKSGDNHHSEAVGALGGDAEIYETFGERFEPTVECTPEHLAKLIAGGCGVRSGGNQGATGRELFVGEIPSPGVDDGSQQGARRSRLQLAQTSLYPPGHHVAHPEQGVGDQFLFAAREVVLKRSAGRVRFGHDLSHPGPRHTLAPD